MSCPGMSILLRDSQVLDENLHIYTDEKSIHVDDNDAKIQIKYQIQINSYYHSY